MDLINKDRNKLGFQYLDQMVLLYGPSRTENRMDTK